MYLSNHISASLCYSFTYAPNLKNGGLRLKQVHV